MPYQDHYFNLSDINPLQKEIMVFIDSWIRTEKTMISKQEIVREMVDQENKTPTVLSALNSLLKKGYIRKATVYPAKKTFYVQLRTI
jgi:Fe2+ or Zn2+ uptake regulation protein